MKFLILSERGVLVESTATREMFPKRIFSETSYCTQINMCLSDGAKDYLKIVPFMRRDTLSSLDLRNQASVEG